MIDRLPGSCRLPRGAASVPGKVGHDLMGSAGQHSPVNTAGRLLWSP